MLNSNYHFEMLKRNISVVFSNIFLNLSTFSSWNVKFKLWRIRKSKSGRTSRKFVCFSKSRRPNVFLELLFKVGVNQSEFRLVRLRSLNSHKKKEFFLTIQNFGPGGHFAVIRGSSLKGTQNREITARFKIFDRLNLLIEQKKHPPKKIYRISQA